MEDITSLYLSIKSDHYSVNDPAINQQVEALYKENSDQQPQVTDVIPAVIPTPTTQPKAQMNKESIEAVEQPALTAPFINDIAWSIKENIPSIEYTAHIFAESSDTGFVILNGAKKHAGEGFRNGIYVEKIETDSVTLSYHGVLFKLAAMKSWIN